MLNPVNLHFQKLQFADLPLLHQWLNTTFVTEWYSGEPTSLEGISELYGPYIDGREPNQSFLIIYDTTPIGYIQTYKIRDYPEWYQELQPTDEAAGLDLFIGHADYIHRGLGNFVVKNLCSKSFSSKWELKVVSWMLTQIIKLRLELIRKPGSLTGKPFGMSSPGQNKQR